MSAPSKAYKLQLVKIQSKQLKTTQNFKTTELML